MKKVYLYCDPRSLNDATSFYVGVVKDAFIESGYDFYITHQLITLCKADIIMTITERYYLQAKLAYPFKRTVYWSQGVDGEEAKWEGRGILPTQFRFFAENMAVNNAGILLLVSDAMLEYHRQRYGYKGDDYIIMPCFNKTGTTIFNIEQYSKPSFVYAGNASVWQAVDLMLDVFAGVEQRIPEANITILTKNEDEFLNKLQERSIRNYEIKYVSLQEIDIELHKYKYGMIVREPHIVNKVATPTKMSTYLASYLIPIFTDAVDDFKRNIELGEFKLCADSPLEKERIVDMICTFESDSHDYSGYSDVVNKVFETHYNREMYKDKIKSMIHKKRWAE